MNYFIAFVCCSSDKENVSEEEKQDHEGTEHEGKEDGAHDQHEDHEDDEVMFSLIGVFFLSCVIPNGSFTLPDWDMDDDSDTDSKPNGYIVLYRTFHKAWTWTRIPAPYFCIGQESESKSVPDSISGNNHSTM